MPLICSVRTEFGAVGDFCGSVRVVSDAVQPLNFTVMVQVGRQIGGSYFSN